MTRNLSKPFAHTFLGLIQLLGINVPHGSTPPPDVHTRAQKHSCQLPFFTSTAQGRLQMLG